jgi:hypothetical protein
VTYRSPRMLQDELDKEAIGNDKWYKETEITAEWDDGRKHKQNTAQTSSDSNVTTVGLMRHAMFILIFLWNGTGRLHCSLDKRVQTITNTLPAAERQHSFRNIVTPLEATTAHVDNKWQKESEKRVSERVVWNAIHADWLQQAWTHAPPCNCFYCLTFCENHPVNNETIITVIICAEKEKNCG